jgi:transposase
MAVLTPLELILEYEDGHSLSEIARQFGWSMSRVRTALLKAGLKLRTLSEAGKLAAPKIAERLKGIKRGPFKDLSGQTFKFLTVTDQWKSLPTMSGRRTFWLCKCRCGKLLWVMSSNLSRGNTGSCGICSKKGNKSNLRHGYARHQGRHPTWKVWQAMWKRCTDRNARNANRYVKRGISVCNRWKRFEAFLEDMGDRPPTKSLDRINNNLGYSPENCRWATVEQQARNKCNTKLTLDAAIQIALRVLRGESQRAVANDFNISKSMVSCILKGKAWKGTRITAAFLLDLEKDSERS